ncbi:hypothetical protein GCM10027168_16650 [Streptomyces capparidis]
MNEHERADGERAGGAAFLAGVVATGRIHGVGIGSSLEEVARALPADYVDVADAEDSLRRDFGFVELYLSGGPAWTVTGGSVELHRLAGDDSGMAEAWRRATGVAFPGYCSWAELREELSSRADAPALEPHRQGGYREFRAPRTKVTVLVVDDEDEDREDGWPGHGDVWSVSLG